AALQTPNGPSAHPNPYQPTAAPVDACIIRVVTPLPCPEAAVDNLAIAQFLRTEARSLADRHDNLYRVRAYRRAAAAVMGLDRPVAELLSETGLKGLRL